MNVLMILLTAAIIIIFIVVNYYIGNTGWKYYGSKITLINIRLYWMMFMLLSLTYILPYIPGNFIPDAIGNILSKIGAYWLSVLLYSFIFFLAADILSLIIGRMRKKNYLFSRERINDTVLHNIAIFLIIFILVYGIYRAYFPAITHYDVGIEKSVPRIDGLHIVMVSDIHIGNILGKNNVSKMVKMINSLKPDVIILCGDIINSSSSEFNSQNAGEILEGLNARYGVYAVPGNHDYYDRNDLENKLQCYKDSNFTLLRDNYAKIADSVYLIGRDDIESKLITNENRKSISELLHGIDTTMPVILLDHQPDDIDNAEKNGVDLQLSGHTHGGQTFISNIFSKRISHKLVYGISHTNDLSVIVTSGYGTWGIPMRTGSRSEIADININFKK